MATVQAEAYVFDPFLRFYSDTLSWIPMFFAWYISDFPKNTAFPRDVGNMTLIAIIMLAFFE